MSYVCIKTVCVGERERVREREMSVCIWKKRDYGQEDRSKIPVSNFHFAVLASFFKNRLFISYKYRYKYYNRLEGSGCGSVGSAVVSYTRESSHQQILFNNCIEIILKRKRDLEWPNF